MAVARDHLGRGVLAPQAERVHHPLLDRGAERGVGPHGPGELADRGALDRAAQPLQVAVGLEGEAGQAQPEGGRLGVDAVGAADAERVAVLEGAPHQGVAVGRRTSKQDDPGLLDLERERGVEHIGGGQAVVDPAPLGPDLRRDHVDEGGDVVVGGPLPLLDRLDRERGARAAGLGRLGRHDPLGCERVGHRQLDRQPAVHLAMRRPDAADLLSRIAPDHLSTPESPDAMPKCGKPRHPRTRSGRAANPSAPGREAEDALGSDSPRSHFSC